MTSRQPRSPVRVAFHVTESGKRGVRWTCDDHPQARGFHHFARWTDHIRKTPTPDAWSRAHDGARLHHHKLHEERTPMSHPTLDTTHPRWIEGERAANVLLDLGPHDLGLLGVLIATAEQRAEGASARGDHSQFLKAHGFATVLRERREETAT